MKTHRTQKGFTIIELTIATLVFSVLLVIIMAAFLGVGRLFVKGANLSLTQQDARSITDSISNDIRFSSASPTIGPNPIAPDPHYYFCVGIHRYKFMLHTQVNSSSDYTSSYGLVREDVGANCPAPPAAGSNPVEMLSNGMQLNDLHFGTTLGDECSGNLCKITINLLFYGADSNVFASYSHPGDTPAQALLETDAHCAGSNLGTQFCASTSYATTVLQTSLRSD